ncbi:BA75_00559T0 [Komagataella pastoris]|uniref:BA75_00559T0 n=1 Tax=Komagataella pastoris TaxID=4922 RepID=A0A1B2J628_PICPA|nr:BA75_00559T0 [Komagataella pastoris]
MIVEDYEYVVGNRPTTYHVAIPKEISSSKPVLKLRPEFIKSRNCGLYLDEEFYHFLTFLTLEKANILWEALVSLKGNRTVFQNRSTNHDKLVFMKIWRDHLSTLDIFR